MFDYEAPKEKTHADWSGTIIGLSLLPLFFLFVYLGKPEVGFSTVIVLAMIILAIKLRWKLRMHIWFWATIILVLLLHVPLVFLVHWRKAIFPPLPIHCRWGLWIFFLSVALSDLLKSYSLKAPLLMRSISDQAGK
jgi:hypothetical protein